MAWSFAEIRPQLDHFFENLRSALAAPAASGVDRRRLEDFLQQATRLQERLYACLESSERAELKAIVEEIQVLAYRTRILFGSPLSGAAWKDVQVVLAEVPTTPVPMRTLEDSEPSRYASGDLLGDRRNLRLPDRTLVSATPAHAERTLEAPDLSFSLTVEFPVVEVSVVPPEAPVSAPAAIQAEPPPPEEPEAPPEAPARPPEPLFPALAWEFPRWPLLTRCLAFLLGAIAAATIGGLVPLFTTVAGGIICMRAVRP